MCNHINQVEWVEQGSVIQCGSCGDKFYTQGYVEALVDRMEDSATMLASYNAAVLWELHERVSEKDRPVPYDTDTAEEDCVADGHLWADGTCSRCGVTQFLGGS